MAKIILKEVAKIVIVVVESCCRILVLAVMVTVWRSFSAVTNPVATISDRWTAVILSTDLFLGAPLKDFYKAFDFIPHELNIAKMAAYGIQN